MNEEKQNEIIIQKVEERYVLSKDGNWVGVKVHIGKDKIRLTVSPKDQDGRFNFTRSKPSTILAIAELITEAVKLAER